MNSNNTQDTAHYKKKKNLDTLYIVTYSLWRHPNCVLLRRSGAVQPQ